MSIVSPFHDVVVYGPTVKPFEGQRLSIITFKTPKERKDDPKYKKPENRCVSVPKLVVKTTVTGKNPSILDSAMQALFEDLQDAVIRKLVVEAVDDDAKVITVSDDQIGFAACAAYAAENAISGKLTKEAISTWFDADLQEKLEVALANAMSIPDKDATEDQIAKLNAAVKQHKDFFAGCAATRPDIPPKIAKSLLSALKLAEEDRISLSLKEKLQKLANPKDTTFFGL